MQAWVEGSAERNLQTTVKNWDEAQYDVQARKSQSASADLTASDVDAPADWDTNEYDVQRKSLQRIAVSDKPESREYEQLQQPDAIGNDYSINTQPAHALADNVGSGDYGSPHAALSTLKGGKNTRHLSTYEDPEEKLGSNNDDADDQTQSARPHHNTDDSDYIQV